MHPRENKAALTNASSGLLLNASSTVFSMKLTAIFCKTTARMKTHAQLIAHLKLDCKVANEERPY